MGASPDTIAARELAERAVAVPTGRAEQWARAVASCVFLLATAYTLYAAHGMSGGMEMPGGWTMPMMWMAMPGQSLAGSALVFLLMWQAMMIAMMLQALKLTGDEKVLEIGTGTGVLLDASEPLGEILPGQKQLPRPEGPPRSPQSRSATYSPTTPRLRACHTSTRH